MKKCIFCDIVDKKIPCTKIYEDNDVLAFLDIAQTTAGHALVIPKVHFHNFLSTPKDLMNKVMNVAQSIGQAQISNLHARGVNILTNCYEAAGQSIEHFHVHVIPRYMNQDGFVIEFHENKQIGEINLPMLATKISKNLK